MITTKTVSGNRPKVEKSKACVGKLPVPSMGDPSRIPVRSYTKRTAY